MINEIRDSAGNLLVSSQHRYDVDTVDIRISASMLLQMERGSAILIRAGYDGQPVMEMIRQHDFYR